MSYTHGHADSVLRSHRWRTAENSAGYLIDRLTPGMDVLDVGCGPGTITVDLARHASPGRVVGVDTEPTVLDLGRSTARELGVTNVEFAVGDAYDLPSEGFDVVHAHQVLQHLTDPVAGLRQMLRAARPGGLVAVRDADYAGMIWWPPDPRLDRWLEIYRSVARDNGGEPDAGRRLLAWAHAAGATGVVPSTSIWSYATPDERAWWGGMWAERIVSSRLADLAVTNGRATREELQEISDAWRTWAAHPDGWFAIPHGEILITA
jgi:SAM-dependent methyltransferase